MVGAWRSIGEFWEWGTRSEPGFGERGTVKRRALGSDSRGLGCSPSASGVQGQCPWHGHELRGGAPEIFAKIHVKDVILAMPNTFDDDIM